MANEKHVSGHEPAQDLRRGKSKPSERERDRPHEADAPHEKLDHGQGRRTGEKRKSGSRSVD